MKKRILILGIVLALAISGSAAFAADTGTVVATVSGKLIALTIHTNPTLAFGTLAVSASTNTTTLNNAPIAMNTGTVTEKFNVKGSDAWGATGNWTLAGAAGADTFELEADDVTNFASPVVLTTSYQELASGIAASGNQTISLRISMPTSITTDYGTHNITVVVQAVE